MSNVTQREAVDLTKQIEQLTNVLSSGAGSVSNLHANPEIGAFSFFASDAQPSMAKAMHGRPFFKNRPVTMPKGYAKSEFDNFGDFIRFGMKDQAKFDMIHSKAISSLAKAMSVNTADFSDGGALVLPEFAPEIMRMLYEGESLWSRTRQFTVAGNSMKFPRLRDQNRTDGNRHGGVISYWLGERDAVTESNLDFDTTDLSLDKVMIALVLTEEMMSDSGYAIEQFATEAVQAELDYVLDRALVRGDGVKKPLGLLNSLARVIVSKTSGQANTTLTADNILNMWARRLSAGAGDDLVWLINQDIEPQLGKLALATGSSSGQLTYTPPGGFADRPYATLMGRPVIPSEHCSTLGTQGDIILTNFKDYLSISKGQVNQVASPHVYFLREMNVIRFSFRVSGRPAYDTPVTMEQSANTRSSIVVLETRG